MQRAGRTWLALEFIEREGEWRPLGRRPCRCTKRAGLPQLLHVRGHGFVEGPCAGGEHGRGRPVGCGEERRKAGAGIRAQRRGRGGDASLDEARGRAARGTLRSSAALGWPLAGVSAGAIKHAAGAPLLSEPSQQ